MAKKLLTALTKSTKIAAQKGGLEGFEDKKAKKPIEAPAQKNDEDFPKKPKDINFQGYEALQYIVTMTSSRHRKRAYELYCDLLEKGLKQYYPEEWKQYLEEYKKGLAS